MHECEEYAYSILVSTLKAGKCLEEVGVDGRIVLKWVLKKSHGKTCAGFVLKQEAMAGCCEHGNEP
jgi:hypothetical protein